MLLVQSRPSGRAFRAALRKGSGDLFLAPAPGASAAHAGLPRGPSRKRETKRAKTASARESRREPTQSQRRRAAGSGQRPRPRPVYRSDDFPIRSKCRKLSHLSKKSLRGCPNGSVGSTPVFLDSSACCAESSSEFPTASPCAPHDFPSVCRIPPRFRHTGT